MHKSKLEIDCEHREMNKGGLSGGNKCLRAGVWGSIVAAICCATPLLAIALGAIGLATITPYLDFVLLPALGLFLFLAFYGWLKSRGEGTQQR